MTIKPKHAGKVSEEKPATRREREKKSEIQWNDLPRPGGLDCRLISKHIIDGSGLTPRDRDSLCHRRREVARL
jgi:hypothetical protein